MKKLFTLLLMVGTFCTSMQSQATTFFLEDFEDTSISYTAVPTDDLSNITNRRYFGRVTSTSGLPTAVMFTNQQGDAFYSAEDTDGSPNNGVNFIVLDFDDVDISGQSMIEFCVFLAEDPTGASEHWDANTSVNVLYDIDNSGVFIPLFSVESEGGTNTRPRIDNDNDGVGEGSEITGVFTQHCFDISGTGSTINLRIEIDKLNNAMEDIAIDNVELKGIIDAKPPVDPIPTMGQWALFILALMMSSMALGFMYISKRNLVG